MKAIVEIDIETARAALTISAGSLEQYEIIQKMTDEEVKSKVLQHCLCWGIKEVKE